MAKWKHFILSCLACGVALGVPSVSGAVDLVNEDNITYRLTVTDGKRKRNLKVRPGETLRDLCIQCEVEVEGIGSIRLGPDDKLIIRNKDFVIDT